MNDNFDIKITTWGNNKVKADVTITIQNLNEHEISTKTPKIAEAVKEFKNKINIIRSEKITSK